MPQSCLRHLQHDLRSSALPEFVAQQTPRFETTVTAFPSDVHCRNSFSAYILRLHC